MIRFLLALLFLVPAAQAACTKMTMPTDFATVTNGTRANLKANFTEIETRVEPCMDSVDEIRGRFTGYTGSLLMSSLENMRLKLDSDASATALFLLENSSGDSLFRVSEDSTAKFFGTVTLNNLTASLPLFTSSTKGITTNAMTGTGSVVMSASPTLTGTLAAAAITASGNSTLAGNVNINGATDASGYRLNVASGEIATSGGSFQSFGVGTPALAAAGNTEYFHLKHSGTLGELRVGKTGSGTFRDLVLYTSDTERYRVTAAGAHTATGALTVTSTVTADSLISSKFYEEGSFTATLTGVTASVTGSATWARVGKKVTLRLPTLTGTSNATTCTITGLPAGITPSAHQEIPAENIIDNGSSYPGYIRVGFDGVLGLYFRSALGTAPGNTFTNSGSKGLNNFQTLSYLIKL